MWLFENREFLPISLSLSSFRLPVTSPSTVRVFRISFTILFTLVGKHLPTDVTLLRRYVRFQIEVDQPHVKDNLFQRGDSVSRWFVIALCYDALLCIFDAV